MGLDEKSKCTYLIFLKNFHLVLNSLKYFYKFQKKGLYLNINNHLTGGLQQISADTPFQASFNAFSTFMDFLDPTSSAQNKKTM